MHPFRRNGYYYVATAEGRMVKKRKRRKRKKKEKKRKKEKSAYGFTLKTAEI